VHPSGSAHAECLNLHLGVQSDPEGSLWRDPPNYWEQIVWPAYVRAHTDMLEGGDIEHGRPTEKVKDLVLIEGLENSMDEVIDLVCDRLMHTAKG
jgi:nicotinamide/nicotinate riboside kinase